MRHNVRPHAGNQACWSSCPGASGFCFHVAAPSPHTDGGWRMQERAEYLGGRGMRANAIAFTWCRAPLAADKHLWTSQEACNKQRGWCRLSLRGLGANWSAAWRVKLWRTYQEWTFCKDHQAELYRRKCLHLNLNMTLWALIGCLSATFLHQTWGRTLRRSRRVKRWQWTRRCYCAVVLPRECQRPRWDTDTEDIYRP